MATADILSNEMDVDLPSGLPSDGTAAGSHNQETNSTREASPTTVKIATHRKNVKPKLGPVYNWADAVEEELEVEEAEQAESAAKAADQKIRAQLM